MNELAPVRNYVALLAALLQCWTGSYLPESRLIQLTETLFESFVGRRAGRGYLHSLPDSVRRRAVASLSVDAAEAAAAVAYLSLRPAAPWTKYIFRWQMFLTDAIDLGVIRVGEGTVRFLSNLMDAPPTARTIENQLVEVCLYETDEHWCRHTADTLGLSKLEFSNQQVHESFGSWLKLSDPLDPLTDPRLVSLILIALKYRNTRVVLELLDSRIPVILGEKLDAKIRGIRYNSRQVITRQLLTELEAAKAGLGAIVEAAVSQPTRRDTSGAA